MIQSTEKPYFSPSQLELAGKCMEAYRRRYVCGDKIPPGIAMLKGTGVDGGATFNFQQKIETHEDRPAAEIVEAAVEKFDQELKSNAGFTVDEEDEGKKPEIVIGKARDDVAAMAEFHAEEQAPDYQPLAVQETFRIELPGPRDVLGIIDLRDDQKRVIDFKTSKKGKSQGDADGSLQLTVYAAGHQVITGEPPTLVRLDTIVRTSTGTKRQVLDSTRDSDDFEALANRMNVLASAIEAGNFPPTTPGAWWCAAKWCGYHATCKYVKHRG